MTSSFFLNVFIIAHKKEILNSVKKMILLMKLNGLIVNITIFI